MSITGMNNVFKTSDTEYGYNIKKCPPVSAGGKLKLYVPKIMGTKSKGKIGVNGNGIFDNAVKPAYAKTIMRQDYVSVELRDNCTWRDKLDGTGMVPQNAMFTVEILNGDIAKLYTTTK